MLEWHRSNSNVFLKNHGDFMNLKNFAIYARICSAVNKCEFSEAMFNVSGLVLQMSRAPDEQGKSFIYLLNLLDYLETLSYFFSRGDLEITDIQNICGNNAIFFFESFKLFIEQRQKHDKKYYSNFTYLYYELKKMQIKIS